MLGKLLKHEFRATGRILLPLMGAVIVLALLANGSMIMLANGMADSPAAAKFAGLRILLILIVVMFFIGIVTMAVMTVVLMVSRFYRNLLKDEGYLMFTLPVSTHELVWAKLIVSFVWFIAAGLLIFLVLSLSALNLSGTELRLIFEQFPSWSEIREALKEAGILDRATLMLVQGILVVILSTLVTCLHFYAGMSLGHMFAKNRILLSIAFFIAISIAFSIMETAGMSGIMERGVFSAQDSEEFFRSSATVVWYGIIMKAGEAALLYFVTVLSLNKGLNLA